MAKLSKIRINGIDYQLDAMATLSPATTATLGGVMVDDNTLLISKEGLLSVKGYKEGDTELTVQQVFGKIVDLDNAVDSAVKWLHDNNENGTPIENTDGADQTAKLKKMLYELRINTINQILGDTGEGFTEALDTIREIQEALKDENSDFSNLANIGTRIAALETKSSVVNQDNKGKILRVDESGNMAAVALSDLISIESEPDGDDTFTAVLSGEALKNWAGVAIEPEETPQPDPEATS